MEKQFSIDRMLLLARSIFAQNKSKDLRLALVIAGIMAFFGMVSSSFKDYDVLGFINVIVLLVLAGTTFKMLTSQPRAMAYLTLPASAAEKTVVTIAYLNIYYFLLLSVSSFVGYYFGQLLQNLIAVIPFVRDIFGFDGDHVFNLSAVSFDGFGDNLLALTTVISVLLFGSLYFRKYAILKTLLTACVFGFAIFFLDVIVISSAGYAFRLNGYDVKLPDLPGWIGTLVEYTVPSVITLFFWFMTYIRLRETEA